MPALRILCKVQRRYLWHVLILPLTLLFLQFEGDTTDGASLDTLHQVGRVAGNLSLRVLSNVVGAQGTTHHDSNLVAKTLGGDDSDFIANAFVGLEVEGELGVVSLDDDLGGLLDSLQVVSLQIMSVLVAKVRIPSCERDPWWRLLLGSAVVDGRKRFRGFNYDSTLAECVPSV